MTKPKCCEEVQKRVGKYLFCSEDVEDAVQRESILRLAREVGEAYAKFEMAQAMRRTAIFEMLTEEQRQRLQARMKHAAETKGEQGGGSRMDMKVLTVVVNKRVGTKKRKGFTLMELLIAIGIAVALAGLLLSAFWQFRQRAFQVTCISNLRQIYLALQMYVQDHDGFFPPYHNHWWTPHSPRRRIGMLFYNPLGLKGSFAPYLKSDSLWFCPIDANAGKDIFCAGVSHLYASYEWFPDFSFFYGLQYLRSYSRAPKGGNICRF